MSAQDEKPAEQKADAKRDAITHDARGNAIWQWAVDSGKHAIDSTSRLLKRLEVPGLKLEDEADAGAAKPGAAPPGGANPAAGAGGRTSPASPVVRSRPERTAGYDPYAGARGTRGPAARPVATKPPASPPPRASLWQRLFRKN